MTRRAFWPLGAIGFFSPPVRGVFQKIGVTSALSSESLLLTVLGDVPPPLGQGRTPISGPAAWGGWFAGFVRRRGRCWLSPAYGGPAGSSLVNAEPESEGDDTDMYSPPPKLLVNDLPETMELDGGGHLRLAVTGGPPRLRSYSRATAGSQEFPLHWVTDAVERFPEEWGIGNDRYAPRSRSLRVENAWWVGDHAGVA